MRKQGSLFKFIRTKAPRFRWFPWWAHWRYDSVYWGRGRHALTIIWLRWRWERV